MPVSIQTKRETSGSGVSGFSGFSGYSGTSGFSGTYSGASGQSGSSGYSGASGIGTSGYSGISGIGSSGYSGLSGYSGQSGSQGDSGYSGQVGSQGISGYSGESGVQGNSGYSGISGSQGFSGYSGESGSQGISGYSGTSGSQGSSGYSGDSGLQGFSGVSGFSSESGTSGTSGTSGISGFSGTSGYSGVGTSGYSGSSGYSGEIGPSGFSGYSGKDGNAAYSGTSGHSGTSGFSGTYSGWSGTSGFSGYSSFSGYSGTSGASGATGGTGGQSYWFHNLSSDIVGYESMLNFPADGAEDDESVIVSAGAGEVLIDSYATAVGYPGVTVIPAGNMFFNMYHYVDNAVGVTQVVVRVYKRSSLGVETELFNFTTIEIDALTATLYRTQVTNPTDIAIDGTDRVVTKVYAKTTSVSNRTVHFVYEGTTHASFVETTLAIMADSGVSGFSGTSGYSGYSGTSGQVGTSGYSGLSGYSGQSGISGTSGTSGYSGASGYSAFSGTSGYSGSSGTSGTSGISGQSGTSGTSGTSGYSGLSGYSSQSGVSGYSGTSGDSGSSGTSGYSGKSGYSGNSGYSGQSGTSGVSGYSGISGDSGPSGLSGFNGATGDSGYSGTSGYSGESGQQGTSGYSGTEGQSGYSGLSGYSSQSGTSGYSGASGTSGRSGPSGISGHSGQGESGYSGTSGAQGASGPSGPSGTSGFSGAGYSGPSGPSGTSGWSGFSGTFSGQSIGEVALKETDTWRTSGDDFSYDPELIVNVEANKTYIFRCNIWVTCYGDDGISFYFNGSAITEEFYAQYSNPAIVTHPGGIIPYIGYTVEQEVPGTIYVERTEAPGFGGNQIFIQGFFKTTSAGTIGLGWKPLNYQADPGLVGVRTGAYFEVQEAGPLAASGWSGQSGFSGTFSGASGQSGTSGYSGESGPSGISGYSGLGISGQSGASGAGTSGWSGTSGQSGTSGLSGQSGVSGVGISGYSGQSGIFSAAYFVQTQNTPSGTVSSGTQIFSANLVSGRVYSLYDNGLPINRYIKYSGTAAYRLNNSVNWGVNGDSFQNVGNLYRFVIVPSSTGTFTMFYDDATPVAVELKIDLNEGQFGASGLSGYSSASGISGPSGISGYSGTSGTSGKSGYSGDSGLSGTSGKSGYSGVSGAQAIPLGGTAGTIAAWSTASGLQATNGWFNAGGWNYSAWSMSFSAIESNIAPLLKTCLRIQPYWTVNAGIGASGAATYGIIVQPTQRMDNNGTAGGMTGQWLTPVFSSYSGGGTVNCVYWTGGFAGSGQLNNWTEMYPNPPYRYAGNMTTKIHYGLRLLWDKALGAGFSGNNASGWGIHDPGNDWYCGGVPNFQKQLQLTEIANPTAPSAGAGYLWQSSVDSLLHAVNDGGWSGLITQWVTAPATSGASGTSGMAAFADGYLYICIGANYWQRVQIAPW